MASHWAYNPCTARAGLTLGRTSATEPSRDEASSLTASQMLPDPPAAAFLPPPRPARDLHGARARITLERVKLDIEATREALGEASELAAGVKSLRQEVELLKAERAAQAGAAREELLAVARTAFGEHGRQLKADLASILQDLLDSVRASEARASRSAIDAKSAAARVQADLDRRLEAVRETALRDSPRAMDASATLSAVQRLEQKLHEVADLLAEQDSRITRVEKEKCAKVAIRSEADLSEKPATLKEVPCELQNLIKEAVTAGTSALPEPQPGASRPSAEPHEAGGDRCEAASSSSPPEPSPPRRRARHQQTTRPRAKVAAGGQRAPPQSASPHPAAEEHQNVRNAAPAAPRAGSKTPAVLFPTSASKKRKTPAWTEQVTPSRRRLLINGNLELEMTKEDAGETAPAGRQTPADVDGNQARMKRRRTIKQDESLESSQLQTAQYGGSIDHFAQHDVVRALEDSTNVAGEGGVESQSESEPDTVEWVYSG